MDNDDQSQEIQGLALLQEELTACDSDHDGDGDGGSHGSRGSRGNCDGHGHGRIHDIHVSILRILHTGGLDEVQTVIHCMLLRQVTG